MDQKETKVVKKRGQDTGHIIFSLIYVLALIISLLILKEIRGIPQTIKAFDLLLIIFAVFRLIRLFVYDDATQFIRDMSVDQQEIKAGQDEYYIKRLPQEGLKLTFHDFITCPWCTGMWIALIVTFAYFVTPYAWYVILLFAVAGMGTFLQLISNILVALQKKAKD